MRIGGVTLQIVRDWVVKFNAAGPDGLIDRKEPEQPSLLNATAQRWSRRSNGARYRSSMASCAGGSPCTSRPALTPLLMDQAGWHLTPKLDVPANISIVVIPSKSPELSSQENVWQFMRDKWLSNRVFGSSDEIVDHCCGAWNKLVEQPWRIILLGLRAWTRGC